MKTILPLTYWGSIEQFANLVQGGEEAIIDLGENYVKRSERNRTEIVTPTGGMVLSVPLVKANRPRTPMRDMRIDNSKRWQHQHWIAILSAYRSSPYFDYIADRIAPIYEREWGIITSVFSITAKLKGVNTQFYEKVYFYHTIFIILKQQKKEPSALLIFDYSVL